MTFFDKNRLLFWTLLVLVLINISALITFFMFTRTGETTSCASPGKQQCYAFREELGLTDDQNSQVMEINRIYRDSAHPIAAAIREARASVLHELEKENPDTNYLNSQLNTISDLQFKIQKENLRQYMALKRVCTPEQAQKLSALYHELYGCPMQAEQFKHRHRRGQGNSDKFECE
jgi:Spy/CpxP family protein refolding chaperone